MIIRYGLNIPVMHNYSTVSFIEVHVWPISGRKLIIWITLGGHQGSVAEWSKALVLGTSLNEAWVRIPPLSNFFHTSFQAYFDTTL